MSLDWPQDPVVARALDEWGTYCDELLATGGAAPVAPVVAAVERSRPRRGLRPPVMAVAACALALVVAGVAVRLNARDGTRAADVAVGTSGQRTEPTTTPTTLPAIRTERAARSDPVGPVSGPASDPCGATPTLAQYALPSGTTPVSVAAGEGGSVWFVDSSAPSIGHLRVDGAVTLYPLPAEVRPLGIALGPGGDIWFTDVGTAGLAPPAIVRMTLAGAMSRHPLPTTEGNSLGAPAMGSHPLAITAGPDGAMWFTESGADQIGRITADGAITEFPLPSRSRMHAAPTAIVAGPDGAMWFSQPLREALGRIDVATYAITEVFFPNPGAGLVRGNSLTAGPGALWFDDPRNFALGRVSTSGQVDALELPGNRTLRPSSVTTGPDGNLWFIEQRDGRVMRFAPAVAATVFPTIDGLEPTGSSQFAVASDRALWFAVGGAANRIGRISCPG